jgi:hypothetical protein
MVKISLLASLLLSGIAQVLAIAERGTTPVWLTLPPTPPLPSPISGVRIPVDGVELWIQKYNEDARKTPLVFDHGGLGYSATLVQS